MKKSTHSLCTTSVYLCMGVMDILNKPEHTGLYQTMADKHSGHCGMVSDLIYVAEHHEKWFKDREIDYEEMTDGVYDYDILEDELSVKIVEHIARYKSLPSEGEMFDILDGMHSAKNNKNVVQGPSPGSRVIEV